MVWESQLTLKNSTSIVKIAVRHRLGEILKAMYQMCIPKPSKHNLQWSMKISSPDNCKNNIVRFSMLQLTICVKGAIGQPDTNTSSHSWLFKVPVLIHRLIPQTSFQIYDSTHQKGPVVSEDQN